MENSMSCSLQEVAKEDFSEDCILMFSGGRDSTIAALRMNEKRIPLRLVTVSSGHLFGMDRVRTRVRELSAFLPPSTPWLQIRQPTDLRTDTSFYELTCLPCHHSYVVVSGAIAASQHIRRLAFGYASYQNDWPEQTPLAIDRLKTVLAKYSIRLELPTYDVESREHAISILADMGLSSGALEQKCLQQISNVKLSDDRLKQQIGLWESAIDASMSRIKEISIDVVDETTVGEV